MTRRLIAFVLIGSGVGLIVGAAVGIVLFVWTHHMFIFGIRWRPSSILLALPFLLILFGSTLLLRRNSRQNSD
jgi:MFS family permease